MIIFYHKTTGKIFGTVDGRTHQKDVLEKSWIQPSNIDRKHIGKYIVKYEPHFEMVNGKKESTELLPKGILAKEVLDHELGKRSLLSVKITSSVIKDIISQSVKQ